MADVSNREVNNLVPQCKQGGGRSIKVDERDEKGRTALHYSSICPIERPEIVRILLVELNADTSVADADGQLPLHLAAAMGRISILKTIIQHGEVNHQRTNHQGQTALHTAVITGNISIISCLLESGARVNAHDSKGMTPLHFAFEIQQGLLEKKKRNSRAPGARGMMGTSAKDDEKLDMVSAHAADAQTKEERELQKRENIVVQLLEAGADLDARNQRGETPYTTEMQRGHYRHRRELCRQVVLYNRRRNKLGDIASGWKRKVARLISMCSDWLPQGRAGETRGVIHPADKAVSAFSRQRGRPSANVPAVAQEADSPGDGSSPSDSPTGPPDRKLLEPMSARRQSNVSFGGAGLGAKRKVTLKSVAKTTAKMVSLVATTRERPELEYKEAFRDIRIQKAVDAQWQATARKQSLSRLMLFTCFLASYLLTGFIRAGSGQADVYEHQHGFRRATIDKIWDARGSTYTDIMFGSDFYQWLDSSFIEMVEGSGATTVSPAENEFHDANGTFLLSYAKLLGTPRLLQFRSKDPSTCNGAVGFNGPGTSLGGNHHYSCGLQDSSEDLRKRSFGPRPFVVDTGETQAQILGRGYEDGFRWRSMDELKMDQSIAGMFGNYDSGAYMMPLDLKSAASLRNLSHFLQANDWIDGATRAIVIELETYNRPAGLFCHLQFIFEKTASSGVFVPVYKFRTAMLSPYDNWAGPWLLCSELVNIVFMFFFARDELKKINADGLGTYVGKASNLANLLYQVLFFVQLALGAVYPLLLNQIDFNDPSLSLTFLFDYQYTRQILYTINLALMWFKFMDHLQAFKSTAMFVLILVLMTEKLFEFLVVQVVTLTAFSTIDHFLFSFRRHSSRTMWASFSSKWVSAFWQEQEIRFRPGQTEDTISSILDMAFVIITCVLLMNFLITLLVDMYDQVKDEAAIRWCAIQAQMLYDGEVTSRSMSKGALHRTNSRLNMLTGMSGNFQPPPQLNVSPANTARQLGTTATVKLRLEQQLLSHSFGHVEQQLKKDVHEFCKRILERPYDKTGNRLGVAWFRENITYLYPEISFGNNDGDIDAAAQGFMKAAITSMEQVFLILVLPHSQFTAKDKMPLSREEHQWAKTRLDSFIQNDPINLDVLLSMLAISYAGKLKTFCRDVFDESGDQAVDSDAVVLIAITKCIHLLPSIKRQSAEQRSLIRLCVESEFNLGQMMQAENVPATLLGLLIAAGQNSAALQMCCIVWLLRISISLHIRPLFLTVRDALDKMLDIKSLGPKGVYESFLQSMATKLDTDYASQRHIVRLSCMMRLGKNQQGQLKEALAFLSPKEQQVLRVELACSGMDDGTAILCTFAPDLLRNIKDSTSSSSPLDGLYAGLVLLARIFTLCREKLQNKGVTGNGVHRCSLQGLTKLQLSPPLLYLKMQLGIEFFGNESVMHFSSRETHAGSFRTKGLSEYDVPKLPSQRTKLLDGNLHHTNSKRMARRMSIGFDGWRKKATSQNFVVFIEGTDPANFLCVLAMHFMIVQDNQLASDGGDGMSKSRKLHVVLMGRHVDLGAQCLTPPLLQKEFEKGKSMKDLLKAKEDMQSNAEDSQASMNDLAVRLVTFLQSAGVSPASYTIYNGGVSPTAMISHEMHQREFMFDRADLSGTGSCGDIVDSGSYWKIIRQFNGVEAGAPRQKSMMTALRAPDEALETLSDLSVKICAGGMAKMVVGGPMTSLKELLEIGGQKLADKIGGIYATMGAWDIGKEGAQGLFNNQFNIGCDIGAAATMLCTDGPQPGSLDVLVEPLRQRADSDVSSDDDDGAEPRAPVVASIPGSNAAVGPSLTSATQKKARLQLKCGVHIVPTETTKHRQLALTPDDLQKFHPPRKLQQIYQLWYELNGKRPFFLFDLAPVLALIDDDKQTLNTTKLGKVL
jgi:hypothetical protein